MSFQARPDTIEKKTGQTPRKVVAGYFLSLDGVAEAPDRFITAWNDETDASGANLIATQAAVILGRRSYYEWAEFWPGSEIQPPPYFPTQSDAGHRGRHACVRTTRVGGATTKLFSEWTPIATLSLTWRRTSMHLPSPNSAVLIPSRAAPARVSSW